MSAHSRSRNGKVTELLQIGGTSLESCEIFLLTKLIDYYREEHIDVANSLWNQLFPGARSATVAMTNPQVLLK